MAGESAKAVDVAGAMIIGPVPAVDWLIVAPVLIPLIFGALLLMFRHEMRWHGIVALIGLAALVGADAALLSRVLEHGPLSMTMGSWLPPFGISFTADALGATFALTAGIVAFVCAIFALRDIDVSGRRYGFYPFLMLMMTGVSGAFLTGDIFNLYVWFEVFVISSFGLLVLGSERAQIDGATKYAILNLVGTTLFLIATAYLYGTFGTLNMADIARKAPTMSEAAPLMTLATLYLLAFGMKAAAFPVNFWLPASYHTPRIVAAALFGGLLTKIGIYALLRTLVMLFPVERSILADLIGWVAVATMILGVLGALAQSDTRRVFGFLVISGVGVMMAGLALGTETGLSGTIFYAVHSMLIMTALYLLAGVMKEMGGSFSLHELSGLYRASPLLTAIALLLALAIAGLPPASGLWPKVLLVKAAVDANAWWLAGAILLTGFLTTIAMGRIFLFAFWRDAPAKGVAPVIVPATTALPALGQGVLVVLTVPIVLLGIFPEPVIRVANMAAAGLLNSSAYINAVFPAGGG
ncbi:multicomponent Na+:H+ antiporter subunit D [Mesorhizobium soli]|jgi:multicomponent Na+:H+ antiporter subunit D|uniref:Na+/H+ antiporter subunit D n=1 Tax=Pseudaminobacter soli (ex Li et al. 2025) TaxID=1295366 RepID=UPI00247379E3|nr:Na+/H+ antiporter subunit D [Mesorhizobium soli]MDH6230090.1 multicomponent Na+:H+ antiporter subunit D [Mesorhizobium soli]